MSVADLVQRGVQLRAGIERMQKELAEVEGQLKALALGRPEEHVPLIEGEREGTRWHAASGVYVVFTADSISSTVKAGSEQAERLAQYAEGKLGLFYEPQTILTAVAAKSGRVDGLAFRRAARAELVEAERFIEAAKSRRKGGAPVNRTVVDWAGEE